MSPLILGKSVFSECSLLTSITLPSSITDFGIDTFNSCGFTYLDLSSYTSLTSIGNNAFNNCINLTTIIFPPFLTSIGNSAFNNCINLTSITFTNVSILPNIQSDTFTNIGNNPIVYMTDVAYNNSVNTSIFQLLLNNNKSLTLKSNAVQSQSTIMKSNYFTMKSVFSNNANIMYKTGSGSSSTGSSGVRNAKIKYKKT
jgi:hypothetical protein